MSLYDSPSATSSHTRRLLIAVVLCMAVLLLGEMFAQRYMGTHLLGQPLAPAMATAPNTPATAAASVAATPATQPIAPVVAENIRLPLASDRIEAAINLRGGAPDTLRLTQYREELEKPAGFNLLAPEGAAHNGVPAQIVVAGWLGAGIEGPSASSQWQPEADQTQAQALTLVWRNNTGQSFQRTWQLQNGGYIWKITERVVNSAALPVTLTPYAQLVRYGADYTNEKSNWVNYFGPMGLHQSGEDTLLQEMHFSDIQDIGKSEVWQGTNGWLGLTSQYFVSAIVPPSGQTAARQFAYNQQSKSYTAGVQFAPQVVAANGGTAEVSYHIYTGPKQFSHLREAGSGLEQAIAWGWFEPLVKGFYHVLLWLHGLLGDWGLAIVAITLLLKIATFPLANASYRAMAKLKKLQPQVEKLKTQHEGNQQAMAMAMMKLYGDNKVSPMSGCWPMLIQIPIFFAMYKVVLVMFEFRHASFLWMNDLAVHDPFYVLPVAMGASMWVQFKLNPKPTDPMQEVMFKWMPLMMTVLFLWFPAGLVLYWLINNLLSIAQQAWMMKREKAL